MQLARGIAHKLRKLRQLAWESLDLLRTLDPTATGKIKVFGSPHFGGGPSTKLQQLQSIVARPGEPYAAVLCLSAVQVPLSILRLLKTRGAKLIVNQNGIYYPRWYGPGYERKNHYLRKLNELADYGFFQCEFALQGYRRWVGPPPATHTILYNAVDHKRFYPRASAQNAKTRVLFFHDIKLLNQWLWKNFLEFMNTLDPKDWNHVEWIFMGGVQAKDLHQSIKYKLSELQKKGFSIICEWSPKTNELPKILRDCDISLHLVYNDVCPNRVLEALASGLYVVALSAGGTKELLQHGGGSVVNVPETYDTQIWPEPHALAAQIQAAVQLGESGRIAAAKASQQFALPPWLKKISLSN